MSALVPDDSPLRTRLARANEMFDGAVAELAAGRLNNAINRAYYACFHIGVCLRIMAGDSPERIDPTDGRFLWSHGGTMNRLRELIRIHGLPSFMPAPASLLTLRLHADYYADTQENGVSLESAAGSVAQATQLRTATASILRWDRSDAQ